ncbi:AlpA family transcriptional regulator [Acidocella sp.]|uniref:helix-turn-helix transcriptional regulator n=1 Tax=Acidocella sp. TaxID=50710 RepID=UPI00260A8C5D|nr:DNA-binding protein [Acidocella sp.]
MKIEQNQSVPALHVRVVSEAEAAVRLSLSRRVLQEFRLNGTGPAFIKLGMRRIGYDLRDLDAWVAARRVRSTAAQMAGGVA